LYRQIQLLHSAAPVIFYFGKVIDYQDIPHRLAAIRKDRRWLAKQLRFSENTIRQYLGPKGKRTKELMEEIERVIVLEEARQRENQADAPPWNVLFQTADQFDRVDRASRAVKAESVIEFCRGVLLNRADEILAEKSRGAYPKLVKPVAKVADKSKKDG
jgi:hypothetical protein